MKKSLFMLGLAVAAMTSCSNDELMEVNTNNVITFESHVNNGTRAATTTATSMTMFQVWGHYEKTPAEGGGIQPVFTGQEVTGSGSNWTYTNKVAWTGHVYQFGALSTGTSDPVNGAFNSSGVLTIDNYTVNQAHDLVGAVKEVDNTGLANQAVAFDFKHLLSKVQFAIKNGSSENLSMEVTDITFTVNNTGKCVYNGTASWSGQNTSEEITVPGTTTRIEKNETFTSDNFLVIPQSTAGITASFKVQFYNGNTPFGNIIEYNNIPMNGGGSLSTWAPGYIYEYSATASAAMPYIEFNVNGVEGWVTATPSL